MMADPSSSAGTEPAAHTSATAAAWMRMRDRATRTLAFLAVLCLGIALLLTALDGGRFIYKLSYSFCIGTSCLFVNDAARLAQAWLTDRLRAARGLPLDAAGFGSGWRGVGLAAVMSASLGPVLGLWLGDRLTGLESPSLLSLEASNTRVTLTLSLLGTLASVFVLSTMERLSDSRAQAEAAHRLAAETQLKLLQSQLEPHMLFNTLANLRVLIGIDAPRAQAMLDRLIAFLRATLQATRQGRHSLAAEFEHLADYLALMSMRMGPRLTVRFDLDDTLRQLTVPALLLQPLVENAIKHGLEPKVEGGHIEVAARDVGDALVLTVRDTGIGLRHGAQTAGSAFGLEQVRTRLATLYGDRASLTLQAASALGTGNGTGSAAGTLATVRLPIVRAAGAPKSAQPSGEPPSQQVAQPVAEPPARAWGARR